MRFKFINGASQYSLNLNAASWLKATKKANRKLLRLSTVTATAAATATATNTEAEPAAKQFVSPPSNLSSKANVLQFVNKKISLRFLRLLGPVCSRSFFAPPDTCLHCLCCCFVCCLHVIGYLSVSVLVAVPAPVLVCLPLSHLLFSLSLSLWQLLCK